MPRRSKPPPKPKPKSGSQQTPQSQLEATRRLQQRIPGESPYQRYARISRGLMPKKSGGAIKLQRGGMSPGNPNVNTPPSWARPWMYQGRGQGGGPFAGQMPASRTNRDPQAERDRLAAFQAQQQRAYQGRLGTGIGGRQLQQPPRRPPPKIRPGY